MGFRSGTVPALRFGDFRPALEDRPAARFASELMPDYPTGIPAGLVPRDWLTLLAAGELEASADAT